MNKDCHIEVVYLQKILCKNLSQDFKILKIIRIYGGARKVTYKIECNKGFSCILYVWDNSMDYFNEKTDEDDIFKSNGADLFELNNKFLTQNGIRTPRIYYIDRNKKEYSFDFALVEYIAGGEIEKYFYADEETKYKVFTDLSKNIKKMHFIRNKLFGNLKTEKTLKFGSERILLDRNIKEIEYSSRFHEGILKNKTMLINKIQELYDNMKPRNDYVFIHGELGPNHVLVDENLNTYLIDIESAMFFDAEYEHSFLQFRFGEYYKYFNKDNLDLDRLKFYKMHLHISCLSGALELKQKSYPDITEVNDMIEYNSEQALNFLGNE